MIAIDTQILVYAHRRETRWHERARDRIAELANTGARWAIPLHCLVEMYGIVTRPRVHSPPSTPQETLEQIDLWLESPTLTVLADDARTWTTLRGLLAAGRVTGPACHDARIAAVCLQHGVTELWTDDRDFLRYPALRTRNPLIDVQPGRAGERRVRYRATAGGTTRSRNPSTARS